MDIVFDGPGGPSIQSAEAHSSESRKEGLAIGIGAMLDACEQLGHVPNEDNMRLLFCSAFDAEINRLTEIGADLGGMSRCDFNSACERFKGVCEGWRQTWHAKGGDTDAGATPWELQFEQDFMPKAREIHPHTSPVSFFQQAQCVALDTVDTMNWSSASRLEGLRQGIKGIVERLERFDHTPTFNEWRGPIDKQESKIIFDKMQSMLFAGEEVRANPNENTISAYQSLRDWHSGWHEGSTQTMEVTVAAEWKKELGFTE